MLDASAHDALLLLAMLTIECAVAAVVVRIAPLRTERLIETRRDAWMEEVVGRVQAMVRVEVAAVVTATDERIAAAQTAIAEQAAAEAASGQAAAMAYKSHEARAENQQREALVAAALDAAIFPGASAVMKRLSPDAWRMARGMDPEAALALLQPVASRLGLGRKGNPQASAPSSPTW